MLVGANKKYDATINVSRTNAPLALSAGRGWLSATTISYNGADYAIFGGGNSSAGIHNAIDVYFNSSGTFRKLSTSLTLSQSRLWLAATSIFCNGISYAIFGGGEISGGYSSTIDVFYINSSGTFSRLSTSLTLSTAREYLAATSISYNGVGYAIFAGGSSSSGPSNAIDVFYVNASGTFSRLSTSLTLSEARSWLAATTISYNGVNYAIFGGGSGNGYRNTIDVFYFNSSGTFSKLSTSVTLSVSRNSLAATSISRNGVDYAIFGGGHDASS